MDEVMGKEHVVSFADFLHELQKEWEFHLNGGTSYRQKTAELSLEVARKVGRERCSIFGIRGCQTNRFSFTP